MVAGGERIGPETSRRSAEHGEGFSERVNAGDAHGRFESKDECDKARQQYISDPSRFPYTRALDDPVGRKLLSVGKVPVPSECVSTDDPRLKGE
jgi:hypothetical protein